MEIPATRFDRNLLATATIGNVGLVLDRYLDPQDYGMRIDRVIGQPVPDLYHAAYTRWRAGLQGLPHVVLRRLRVQGRMIVGIGGASVHDTSITLNRAYGTPFVPGSALKGLARHYARRAIVAGDTAHPLHDTQGEGEPNAYSVLFGHQGNVACVRYFDAWYVPESAEENRPLRRDVITVHHQRYYGSQGTEREPWDFDDPVPVPFLSATGEYLVAVQGPTGAWAELAAEVLTQACEQWGIGAKTSSGYGRLVWTEKPQPRAPHPLEKRVADMAPQRLFHDLRTTWEEAKKVDNAEDQQAVAAAIEARLTNTESMRAWAGKQKWVADMRALHPAKGPSD